MRTLKIVNFLLLCGMLCLCGCMTSNSTSSMTSRQLYEGDQRSPSEVVTVRLEPYLRISAKILENGKWIRLHDGSQVLPGKHDVLFTVMRQVNGFLGLPKSVYVNVNDSFTASSGDTVTYYQVPIKQGLNLNTASASDFVSYTVSK